jgi:hypothetical protein
MRNELVEELIIEGEAKVLQNRTGSSSETVKAARGRANQARKEGMRLPSEKPACPRRRPPSAVRTESGRRQPEQGGKGCWDAEHPDLDWPSGGTASIASQPLLKAETIARALGARQDHVRDGW